MVLHRLERSPGRARERAGEIAALGLAGAGGAAPRPAANGGRGDLTLQRIRANWTSRRGRAVEPLVREALARLLPDANLPAAPAIGGSGVPRQGIWGGAPAGCG